MWASVKLAQTVMEELPNVYWDQLINKKNEIGDYLANKFNFITKSNHASIPNPTEENILTPFTIAASGKAPVYLTINSPVDIARINDSIIEMINKFNDDIYAILDSNQLSETTENTLEIIAKVIVKFVKSFRKKMKTDFEANTVAELQVKYGRSLAKEINDRIFLNMLSGLSNGLKTSDKHVYILVIKKFNDFLGELGIYTIEIPLNEEMDYDNYDVIASDDNETDNYKLKDCVKEIHQLCYAFDEEMIVANGQAVVWRLKK